MTVFLCRWLVLDAAGRAGIYLWILGKADLILERLQEKPPWKNDT